MNILQQEDMIKGLPDDALMQEAQAPSGQVPQFLVVSEIQRRSDMRKRYQEQQQPQGTVAEQIVGQAQQGIAAMQPQAGPMPPQAMPPQGMPPQGMPPQMPPQQMFSGGIIRLSNGGSTGMPGEGALVGVMEELKRRARILSRTAGESFDAIYERLVQQAQLNNPNYSMIAPSGFGFEAPELPEGAGSNLSGVYQPSRDSQIEQLSEIDMGMPSREQRTAADKARVASIREGIAPLGSYGLSPEDFAEQRGRYTLPEGAGGNLSGVAQSGSEMQRGTGIPEYGGLQGDYSFLSDIGDSIAAGYRQTPFAQYSAEAQQKIRDAYNENGIGAVIGQTARSLALGIPALAETAYEGLSPVVSIADTLTSEAGKALDQFVTGDASDPLTLGQIFGTTPRKPQSQALNDASVQGKESSLEEVTVTGKRKPENQLPEDLQLAFDSLRTTSGSDASAKGVITPQVDPSLDLSDLIEDAKRMTRANALMQLGAGIAAGDLSQGLSRAGVAAAQGDQREKAIAIRERMATYQAGREDLAREAASEEKRLDRESLNLYRSGQLTLARQRMEAEISKAERVSAGQLLNFASDIAEEIVGETVLSGDREAKVKAIVNELLRQYAPLVGLDPQTVPLVKDGADRSGQTTGRPPLSDFLN